MFCWKHKDTPLVSCKANLAFISFRISNRLTSSRYWNKQWLIDICAKWFHVYPIGRCLCAPVTKEHDCQLQSHNFDAHSCNNVLDLIPYISTLLVISSHVIVHARWAGLCSRAMTSTTSVTSEWTDFVSYRYMDNSKPIHPIQDRELNQRIK